MIIKVTLGRWRFTFSMAPTTKVVGVNSNLQDGNHILMWDFDTGTEQQIYGALKWIQHEYRLPKIRTARTGKKHGYHAICLTRLPWRLVIAIIASTPLVDYNFIKYGIYRKHFTLRISPKCFRAIHFHKSLTGYRNEDVTIKDLQSWVEYETLQDGWHSKKVELKIFAREET